MSPRAAELLASADITVDGDRPWDIQVHNSGFFARVQREGSLGLGESYMDGWWDCPALDQFFYHAFAASLDRARGGIRAFLLRLESSLFNRQTPTRSVQVARRHYDVGNDLFRSMLGPRMMYTTGLWQNAESLDAAQDAKLDFVCRQLRLEPGMTVLDIGCGWGGFAKFAAERYGAHVYGLTLSRQQLELASAECAGLPVEIHLEDYRAAAAHPPRRFDRIVSLGMFEHVGYRNYRAYFECAQRLLTPNGRMFLSSIAGNRSSHSTDPWIERYIFPNSHLPSIQQFGDAIEDRFIPLDWRNWAEDYDRTLMAWHSNFAARWSDWQRQYGERFCRMWRYYLLASAAAFRARRLQVWQILLAPLTA
ncbi:MAG TPA: cyclopropane fatty acyl phospholipid synthase [Terriglobales bacterium]|nr:cyclopropane fatty acyl phospholipid synthase [Terriglobales bacterium]